MLHAPTMEMLIPRIDETDMSDRQGFAAVLARTSRCTRPINYLGLPAITLPTGFDTNGCPTSLQLIGKPFAEATLFKAGGAFEGATDFAATAPSLPGA